MLIEAISKMPEVFDSKVLIKGQDFFQKGYVLNIRLSDGLLKGRIKDTSNQIYDLHMDLKTWPQKPSLCTCAVQTNCQHAAACLFALRDKEKINIEKQTGERLDKKLDTWLRNLRAKETKQRFDEATHHLVYLLQLKTDKQMHKVIIDLAWPKVLKRGGYGKKQIINTLPESKRQLLSREDNEIIALLFFKCNVYGYFSSLSIRNTELLEKIIATGRAFFMDQELPIELATPLDANCKWVLSANGTQYLKLKHDEELIEPLLLDAPWFYDYKKSILGPLKTNYSIEELHHLLEAPPIPLDQAELLHKKMAKTCPGFPAPQIFKQIEIQRTCPRPVLILDALGNSPQILFTASFAFNYSGSLLPFFDDSPFVVVEDDGKLIKFMRDTVFEEEKISELKQIIKLRPFNGLEAYLLHVDKNKSYILDGVHEIGDLSNFYHKSLPLLKNKGWLVEFESDLYMETIQEEEVEWFSDLSMESNDFFSYQLGILVEGEAVNIVPVVASLIQKYKDRDLDKFSDEESIQLPLKNNKLFRLKMGRIKPLIRLLLQLGIKEFDDNDLLKINKYQIMLMREAELALAASRARWRGAESIREELVKLIRLKDIPEIPVPPGLHTELRDYQQQGFNWLQFLRTSGFGGILADDMGLGKTIQALANLQYEKEQGRMAHATLIIAPTSLVGNWMAEAKRFTPELKILVYHGLERHLDQFDDYDLIISTYGLIHRDKEVFIHYPFYYLILDESQFIKNARAKTTQIIQQIKAEHRLCLTGTPLENHLGELWSLFHFLMPGLLGDAKKFRQLFRVPIEKNGDEERRHLLVQRTKPFMLRRTKNQVAKELPLKTHMIHPIEISGAQRDLYETIRMSMEKKVRTAIAKQGLGKSHILLLDALLKLRQVCCDPRLLSLDEAVIAHKSSAKLEALMELLDNLVVEGRRILVFSQFTSMLKLIETELQTRDYAYLKLTGQTKNRQTLVETFQEGKTPIFLISLKAGGTGLNLTKADTVIHYDPWWNPAVEDQATDRSHRIGQKNPVFVYKLITSGTVEEAILKMQDRKRQLVDGILSTDPAKTLSLSLEDLEQFFMPLS